MRRVLAAVAIVTILVGACGDTRSGGESPAGDGEAWWVLEAPGFYVADAAVHPRGEGPAGQRWALEYSSGLETLQIIAFDRDSAFRRLLEVQPVQGEVPVDGHTMVLRRSPGIPEDEIPPQFGVDWELESDAAPSGQPHTTRQPDRTVGTIAVDRTGYGEVRWSRRTVTIPENRDRRTGARG